MPNRLTLEKPLFPIQTFFNAVSDDSFIRVLKSMADGVGYSINDCDCSFPEDLDPDEVPFVGVRFEIFDDQIIITRAELDDYLREVGKEHISRHPHETEDVEAILNGLSDS